MVNLYSLERMAKDRRMEITEKSLRSSLVRQMTGGRFHPVTSSSSAPSVRSWIGFLMIRLGLRMSESTFAPKTAPAGPCVCFPASN